MRPRRGRELPPIPRVADAFDLPWDRDAPDEARCRTLARLLRAPCGIRAPEGTGLANDDLRFLLRRGRSKGTGPARLEGDAQEGFAASECRQLSRHRRCFKQSAP